MPGVYLGGDPGSAWRGNEEVKNGRPLAKKAHLCKQIGLWVTGASFCWGLLRAREIYASKSFRSTGPGPVHTKSRGHCGRTQPGGSDPQHLRTGGKSVGSPADLLPSDPLFRLSLSEPWHPQSRHSYSPQPFSTHGYN